MGVKLLGKIKIHEIAKEVGLTSKDIIKIANDLGIEVTSHLSAVDDEQAKLIKNNIQNKNEKDKSEENSKAAKTVKKDTTSSANKKDETPVIIRREVIISEEKKTQNTNKSQEHNHKDVGIVERTNKNDYNIT